MTNTQIRAFLTLYNSDSAAKAADKLYITQPALSRIIRSIESELGYELFVRGKGKSLVPTVGGDRFYTIAKDMARLYEQAKNPENALVRRTFRVAATASLFFFFFPDACARFRRRNPHIDLVIDELHSVECYRQMQLRQLDLAVVNAHFIQSGIRSVPLCREKVVLLCSKGLFPPGPVSPRELRKENAVITEWSPDFQSWFEYWFGKSFESSYMRLKTGTYIDRFLRTPVSWAITPYTTALNLPAFSDFEVHELTEPPPDRTCYCIYSLSDTTELEEEFLECLRQSLRGTAGIQEL